MATWATHSTPNTGSETINDILCVGADKFVAIGSNGTVLYSVNAGVTWAAGSGLAANAWSGLAFDGTTVIVVGQTGANRVGKSTDGGATWTMKTASEANSWTAVCSPVAGTFVASAADGTHRIMKSTNSGDTWSNKTAAAAEPWSGIASNSDGSLLMAFASSAATMTSADAGDTWSSTAVPTDFLSSVGQGIGSNVIQYSAGTGKFSVPGYNSTTFVTSMAESATGASWAVSAISSGYSFGTGGFAVAGSIGGFLASLPFDSGATPTPTIVANSVNGGSTWTAEDTTESGLWTSAAWDNANGTIVFWDGNKTNTMLVGTFLSSATLNPDHGPIAGGTSVTITGTGFTSTTAVLFDGIGATITSQTATQIVCLTPTHSAGPVDVTVGGGLIPDGYTYEGSFDTPLTVFPDIRYNPALAIQKMSDSEGHTFSFSVNGGDVIPSGTTVEVLDNDSSILVTGPIVRAGYTLEGKQANVRQDVTGRDNTWFMNRRLVVGSWTTTSASVVLRAILSTFAKEFSPAGIDDGLDLVTVSFFRDMTVGDAFTKICQLIGANWRLDSDTNVVYVSTAAETIDPPDDITDAGGAQLEPAPVVTVDLTQIRTRVYVRGAGVSNSTSYEAPVNPPQNDGAPVFDDSGGNIDTDDNRTGSEWHWHADYIFAYQTADGRKSLGTHIAWTPDYSAYDFALTEFTTASFTVDVLSSPDGRVSSLVVYRLVQPDGPYAANHVAMANPDYTNMYFQVAEYPNIAGGPSITVVDTASEATLVGGDGPLSIDELTKGDNTANIYVMREDVAAQAALAAIEGGDGIHEHQVVDTSLTTLAAANARGDAELALWKSPIITVEYACRDRKSKVGAQVHVDITNPYTLDADFKIQRVDISDVNIDGTTAPLFKVTASSVLFTLEDLLRRSLGMMASGSGGGASAPVSSSVGSGAIPTVSPVYIGETPTGSINGSNTVFNTAHVYRSNTLAVYLNGVRQTKTTDYTESDPDEYTMTAAPSTGDTLRHDYTGD